MKSVVLSCFYMFKVLKPREYYMDINVKSTSLYQQEVQTHSSTETSAPKTTGAIPMNKAPETEQVKKICEKLGLTQDQFLNLCSKIPGFELLSENEQLKIINNNLGDAVTNKSPQNAASSSMEQSQQNSETEQKIVDNGVFNHKAYSQLPLEDKMNIYASELAKNKFLYSADGNKKTPEQWEALTPEQQKALIDAEIKNFNRTNSKELFGDDTDAISKYFDRKMTPLQAANFLGVNYEKFSKDLSNKQGYALDTLHDYIFSQDESIRSDGQNFYMKENAFLSKAVVAVCAESDKDKGEYITDGSVEYNLSGSEILQRLKELGKTPIEVELEYLKGKKNLNNEETARLVALEKHIKCSSAIIERAKEHAQKPADYGKMEALQKTEYGELLNSVQGTDEKAMVLNAYIANSTKNMSPDEKAKFVAELADELLNNPANVDLVQVLHYKNVHEASVHEKRAMASATAGAAAELNAVNFEVYGTDKTSLNNIAQAQNKIAEIDAKRAEGLKLNTINNATEDQMVVLQEPYSRDKSIDVQRANKNRVFTYEKPENQKLAIENIKKNSDETIVAEAAAESDKLHKDYQVEGLQTLTKGSKLATEAANKSEVVTRMAKENQTDAFKVMKSNIEEQYDNDEEAIEQLKTLSDQISKSHKDNQLDMHNEIMQSKYSAVQEHAAANIKDYDPSVQTKAIDTVYETKNEKAIKAVVDNLEKMPPDVQKTEVTRLIGELALNNAISMSDLDAKIFGGNLTTRDLSKLSASQRREYFVKMFDEASPAKKLDMLRNIAASSIGIHKKTIYTIIARFSAPLLKAMVEDGMGKTMIEAGIPLDAVNKIINIMKTSTSNKVIQQRKELEKDSNFTKYFDNQDDKIRITVPQDLKGAFAANIDRKTLEELRKNNATMFIKS